MKRVVVGLDTSCYTTSAAAVTAEGNVIASCRKLLPVPQGQRGLRQSEAVFTPVRQLPGLVEELSAYLTDCEIVAVCASRRPRDEEASYMPVFQAGDAQGRSLAALLRVPCFATTPQRGHVAAAKVDSGVAAGDLLAVHLSGGTTELLRVTPEGKGSVHAEKIGGTTDISAGQLIDRTGKLLGLPFPSGKHIDALSRSAQDRQVFRVKVQGTTFSLSGVQNKVEQYHAAGNSPEETAGYVLRCLIGAIVRATENALLEYPGSSVVFAGGVASNTLLRSSCAALPAIFCPPQFATDNALGVAVLTWRALHG